MKNLPAKASNGAKAKDDFLDDINKPASIPADMEGIEDDEAFAIMEKTPVEQLKELTGSYWSPTPGQHVFKFLSMTTYEGDKGVQEAVSIQDKNGINYVAAQAVLVGALKKVTDMPCFFKVFVGDKKIKGRNGDYFDMKVLVFPSAASTHL